MIEVTGNLWDYPADVTGITTNGALTRDERIVMGRGCAREARDRYPELDVILGSLVKLYGNRCFRVTHAMFTVPFTLDFGRTLLSFPVKHHWRDEADVKLIAQSCEQAMAMADKFGWRTVVLPRPGSGNGRLDYFNDVRPVIEPLLDDRFRIITFGSPHPEQ